MNAVGIDVSEGKSTIDDYDTNRVRKVKTDRIDALKFHT